MGNKANFSNEKTKKPEITFTSGSIPKAMLAFVGPYMLGILLQNLYGAVDLFVVGQYATTADTSAVTIGSQLMSIVTQLIIGFATGITMLIGQYYGAKDKKGLTKTTGSSILLFGTAAIVLAVIYLGFHGVLVNAMQTPQEAIGAARSYLFTCAIGIPFIVGYNVVSSILTGLGDTKTSFIFITVACIINIVLDVVLVRYVHLGALGAAIATTAAQAGSFLFSLLFLKRRGLGFPLSMADIRFDGRQVGRIAKIGGPVAVQNVLVGASFLFVTAIINQIGLVASAAVGVVEKLITFLFVPAIGMSTAVGTASAQNLGAQQYDRARRSMWYGITMALIPSILIAIFCQFGGEFLTRILTKDAEVVLMATDYLHSYIVDVILVSFVFCMNGYFNSCGKSWFSLLHSLVTTIAVRVPASFLLSRIANASLFTIGWAAPASTFVSLIMCLIFLSRQKEEKISFSTDQNLPQQQRETGTRVIITISREYGSGGRLIGELIAKKLGIPFYNRNLIDLTAKESGLAEGYIEKWEEKISSRFIWSSATDIRGGASGQISSYYSNEDKMFVTQSNVILELAEKSCVIVGRCADYVLRDHPDCINVFIFSDMEHKIKRLVDEYGIDADNAIEIAENTDRGRANYYNRYTNVTWGDGRQYHLVIDSGLFGIEKSADLVVDSVNKLYPELMQAQ